MDLKPKAKRRDASHKQLVEEQRTMMGSHKVKIIPMDTVPSNLSYQKEVTPVIENVEFGCQKNYTNTTTSGDENTTTNHEYDQAPVGYSRLLYDQDESLLDNR